MSSTSSDREIVESLLGHHGLTVPEAEIEEFVRAFPLRRQRMAALYELDAVRYEEPAVVFTAKI